MTKPADTLLSLANRALREKKYQAAIPLYVQAMQHTPALAHAIAGNLEIARRKYRTERSAAARPQVAVCGWELSHNAAGRVYTLATLYQTFADVEIIGSVFPSWGRDIWEPIRDTVIPKHWFLVEDESRFVNQAIELVATHPYDIVHLSKPRAPNILFGILYKLIWGANVLLDIDDEELDFVNADAPITLSDYLQKNGKLPNIEDLSGTTWTRLAVGLAKNFEAITVSNSALQKRYGGEIIHHARDEKFFNVSNDRKKQCRERFGIPIDKKVVLFFGTPRENKGLIETAEAISSLKRNDVVFVVVGDFPDQELKIKLQGIKGCDYIFLGNQPFGAIPDVVAMGDCCVLQQNSKSNTSNFQIPAKLSDALGMGLPILVSRLPPFVDVISHGAALPIDGELASLLENVLNDDDSLRILRERAIDFFKSKLTLKNNASKLVGILNHIKKFSVLADASPFNMILNPPLNSDLNFLIPSHWLGQGENAHDYRRNYYEADSLKIIHQVEQTWDLSLNKSPNSNSSSHESIDVVVPVFNALDDVKKCLVSLASYKDGFNVKIIVVNDGSDSDTTNWLREYCSRDVAFHLIEQENSGYTKAVNVGLRNSKSSYVITQNSDTIVAPGWLKGLVRCMNSVPNVGIVGPLSNAASWQNVPDLLSSDGSFAVNELPENLSVNEMARVVASVSKRKYPEVPFVNGFCFMIKRELINAIGYMDEENFPIGYGEENDFCIRASDAGFKLAIADDVYVFHAKSKSFGHDRRKELSRNGSDKLKQKHTAEKFKQLLNRVKDTVPFDEIRARIQQALAEEKDPVVSSRIMQIRILFLLPVKGGGGGAHSVVQEVAEMRRLGLDANIAVRAQHHDGFLDLYGDIENPRNVFVPFEDNDITSVAQDYDVVVATIFSSMSLAQKIVEVFPHILPAYYVQDYEPLFFSPDSQNWKLAYESFNLVPEAFLFAKTKWIADKVKTEHGINVHKVNPSIDHVVYKPQRRSPDGRVHIAAMIRPQTPRRGAERTMRVLSRLAKAHPGRLAFHLFGCADDSPDFQKLARDFEFSTYGTLKRLEVANLLSLSDIFVDLSDYQAFGRTALEAMACGCAAVVPIHGGTDEYAIDGCNAIVVDSLDEDECFFRIDGLLRSPTTLARMQLESLETASRYSVHRAAVSEWLSIAAALTRHRLSHPIEYRRTLVLLPSVAGDGRTPSVSAYLRLLQPCGSKAVVRKWVVKPQFGENLPEPGSADAVILQGEASAYSLGELATWHRAWRAANGKLIFDIDEDLLDVGALQKRGFKGDIEALAEKVQFLARNADKVSTTGKSLEEKLRKLNSSVHSIPTRIDSDLWGLRTERDHNKGPFSRVEAGPIRIGYIGTPANYGDLELISGAIRKIQTIYGKRVEVEVIGGFQIRDAIFGKRIGLPKKNDYPNFVKWLQARVHWDIGLIPDSCDDADRGCMKFLEYAALDMAIVCSDVSQYREVAINNVNSLLVKNTEEDWFKSICMLIENLEKRLGLASSARKMVKNSYSIEIIESSYLKLLGE